jgi:hypothetical protein
MLEYLPHTGYSIYTKLSMCKAQKQLNYNYVGEDAVRRRMFMTWFM